MQQLVVAARGHHQLLHVHLGGALYFVVKWPADSGMFGTIRVWALNNFNLACCSQQLPEGREWWAPS